MSRGQSVVAARRPDGRADAAASDGRYRARPRALWPRAGTGCFAVVAGGGTGGHVVPALAVARALDAQAGGATTEENADGPTGPRASGPWASVRLVGARRGVDARLVEEAGFPVTLIPGRGLVRRLSLSNVAAVAGLAVATCWSTFLLARWRPRVVVSMGGYASVPCGLAAVALRVPLVVVNPDAIPGAANRLLSRFARASAVAFEGTPVPRAVVTGAPVRPEVATAAALGKAAARRALGVPLERALVVAVGGSLGARRINEAVIGLAERWSDRSELALRQVIGHRDWPLLAPRAAALGAELQADPSGRRADPRRAPGTPSPTPPLPGRLVYQAVEYEPAMPTALAAADLVVSRAGAVTVAELCVAGRPAVLVPLPGAPGDHQTANASVLARAGGAVILPDTACTAEGLATVLEPMLGDRDRLGEMGRATAGLARPSAATAVAELAAHHALPSSVEGAGPRWPGRRRRLPEGERPVGEQPWGPQPTAGAHPTHQQKPGG
jgi:UDP-N-acetylglucosamine--N-acetylmuramyl-(pentapeptide) pyrophosphoryl-undecaprenol N-acetylglucosamine transferase